MKKKSKQKIEDFDRAFDSGRITVDFSEGVITNGLSQVVKISHLVIPLWLSAEIEMISKIQANSKSSVLRQLLVEAIEARKRQV